VKTFLLSLLLLIHADAAPPIFLGQNQAAASEESGPDTTLRAWWSFDTGFFGTGSGGIADRTSYGMNGTQTGTLTQATGHLNEAGDFNGSSQYVTCPDIGGYGITTQLTVAGWIKPDNGANRTIIASWFSGANPGENTFVLYLANPDTLTFVIAQSDHATKTTTYSPISNGVWTHVAAVADGSNLRLYVNGTAVGSPTAYDGTIDVDHLNDFNIGAFQNGGVFRFDGLLDELKLWNRGLSAAEVAADAAL
jgi:hypothetical protein